MKSLVDLSTDKPQLGVQALLIQYLYAFSVDLAENPEFTPINIIYSINIFRMLILLLTTCLLLGQNSDKYDLF